MICKAESGSLEHLPESISTDNIIVNHIPLVMGDNLFPSPTVLLRHRLFTLHEEILSNC